MIEKTLLISDEEFLIVSEHAEDQLRDRKIKTYEVIETYKNPDSVYPQRGRRFRKNYQKDFGEHILKIAVQIEDIGPNILVTAFRITEGEKSD